MNICSRHKKQTTFTGQRNIDRIRVEICFTFITGKKIHVHSLLGTTVTDSQWNINHHSSSPQGNVNMDFHFFSLFDLDQTFCY